MNIERRREGLIAIRDALAGARLLLLAAKRPGQPSAEWLGLRRVLRGDGLLPGWDVEGVAQAAARAEVAGVAASLEPRLESALAAALARQRRHHALQDLATEQIAMALASIGHGRRVVLLKGSASSVWVYEDAWHRARRDIDLLVAPGDFSAVRMALWNAGWRDVAVRELTGPPGSGRTFGMSLALGPATIHLDLHRNLVTRPWCGLVGEEFQRRFIAEAVAGRASLPVTSPRHTFLHTVAHLIHSGFSSPAKGFVDLARLSKLVDGDALVQEAAALRLRTATWALSRVVARWFGARPAWDLGALAPSSVARRALIEGLLDGEGPSPLRASVERRLLVHGLPRLMMDD